MEEATGKGEPRQQQEPGTSSMRDTVVNLTESRLLKDEPVAVPERGYLKRGSLGLGPCTESKGQSELATGIH